MRSSSSHTRAVALALLCAGATVTTSPALWGQTAAASLESQRYTIADTDGLRLASVELSSIPWTVRLPLLTWAAVSLEGAVARASMTMDEGERAVLFGPTDTRAIVGLGWRSLTFAAQATLPTGDGARTVEGAAVLGLLNSDLLPFRPTSWGSGFGLGADVGYETGIGRSTLSVGAGYATVNAYAPLPDMPPEYVPATQAHFRVATETRVGAAGVLSTLIGMRRFGNDTFHKVDVYAAGNRLDGVVSYAFPMGAREGIELYGALSHRAAGAPTTTSGARPVAADLLFPGARPASSHQLFVVGAEVGLVRTQWSLSPRTELRMLRRASGLGQGWLASILLTGETRLHGHRFGRRLLLRPRAGLQIGRVIAEEGVESPVLGMELAVGVAWVPKG